MTILHSFRTLCVFTVFVIFAAFAQAQPTFYNVDLSNNCSVTVGAYSTPDPPTWGPYTPEAPDGKDPPYTVAAGMSYNSCTSNLTNASTSSPDVDGHYWRCTGGDPEGYSGCAKMFNGDQALHRPGVWYRTNAESPFEGIAFVGKFTGSMTGRGGSYPYDTVIAAVYASRDPHYLGGQEYGFYRDYRTNYVYAYFSANSNCGGTSGDTGDPVGTTGNGGWRCQTSTTYGSGLVAEYLDAVPLSTGRCTNGDLDPTLDTVYYAYKNGTNVHFTAIKSGGGNTCDFDMSVSGTPFSWSAMTSYNGYVSAVVTTLGQPTLGTPKPKITINYTGMYVGR